MSKRIQRAIATEPKTPIRWLLPVIALAGCSGENAEPFAQQPLGPPGGMIEADGGLRPSTGGTGYGGVGGAAGSGAAGRGGAGDGGQLLNGGIGKVCSSDADCPAGLTCNLDTEDWIPSPPVLDRLRVERVLRNEVRLTHHVHRRQAVRLEVPGRQRLSDHHRLQLE